jgi:hypothetical protein
MNAGMYGLPGGAPARRVTGMLRINTQATAVTNIVSAARAATTGTVAAIADINQLQVITSITGGGAILWGCIAGVGSGNLRTVLEIDGVRVLDQTHSVSATGNGSLFVGGGFSDGAGAVVCPEFQYIPFTSSARVLVATSATGAGNPTCYLNAEVYA